MFLQPEQLLAGISNNFVVATFHLRPDALDFFDKSYSFFPLLLLCMSFDDLIQSAFLNHFHPPPISSHMPLPSPFTLLFVLF